MLRQNKALSLYTFLLCIVFNGNISHVVAREFSWAKHVGTTMRLPMVSSDVNGNDIVTDDSGNVYVVGSFLFKTDFDPGPGIYDLIPVGAGDAFICKLDPSGNFLWARRMGGTYNDYRSGPVDEVVSIAIDTAGDVYVTGNFREVADFGSFYLTSNGGTDAFICKLDPSGNFLWVKQVGGKLTDRAVAMVLDKSGNVNITGSFQDTTDFDPGSGVYNLAPLAATVPGGNPADMFILKINPSGNFLWARNIGGAYVTNSKSIAVDAWGNVYTTGEIIWDWQFPGTGTTDFDPGGGTYNLSAVAGADIFISKLDSSGNFVWAKMMYGKPIKVLTGSSYGNQAQTMTTDTSGNVYIIGHYEDTIDVDPGPDIFELTAGPGDFFLAKLDASGNFLWVESLRGNFQFADIIEDNKGYTYIAGHFQGNVDFDPGPEEFRLLSAGGQDAFVLKLDTSGKFVWAECIANGPGMDRCDGFYVDNCDNIYATGSFMSRPDFDFGRGVFNMTAIGDRDLMIYKMSEAPPPPDITIDTFRLGVSASYNTYQWYLNGVPIPDATDSIYLVTENGDYTVLVTNINGCPAVTDIYRVNNYRSTTGIEGIANNIRIYPNPASDFIYIESSAKLNVNITGMDGRVLRTTNEAKEIKIGDLSTGIYLLKLFDSHGNQLKVEKIVKQ